jgi:hypothetical protein
LPRTLLIVFAGIASLALLIASIASFIWVKNSGNRAASDGAAAVQGPARLPPSAAAAAVTAANVVKPAGGGAGKRFTLRLGQGFRFRDGVVMVAKPDDPADVVFKYLPPQVGGLSTRYNPISQQVETGLEPTLTSPVPLHLGRRRRE